MEQEDEPQTLYDFLCILDDKATALSQISSPDEFKPAAAQRIASNSHYIFQIIFDNYYYYFYFFYSYPCCEGRRCSNA